MKERSLTDQIFLQSYFPGFLQKFWTSQTESNKKQKKKNEYIYSLNKPCHTSFLKQKFYPWQESMKEGVAKKISGERPYRNRAILKIDLVSLFF